MWPGGGTIIFVCNCDKKVPVVVAVQLSETQYFHRIEFLQKNSCRLFINPRANQLTRFKYSSWMFNQRRSNIRTGSAAYFCIIGFLVIFLCIVAPPVGTRSRRVRFVFFYRTSYVGSTSRQHLATVIRYADCVKQSFQTSRRRQRENFTSAITRLLRLWFNHADKRTIIHRRHAIGNYGLNQFERPTFEI